MSKGSREVVSQGRRGRQRLSAHRRDVRKARAQWTDLEGLESRTLLSTIPAATATGVPINLSQSQGNSGVANESSPIVAVDPTDTQKIVAVWVNSDPNIPSPSPNVTIEGAYSTDGGQTWNNLVNPNTNQNIASQTQFDPNTTNPTVPYLQETNPTVGFDRSGNFYIFASYHNAGNTSGELVLEKLNYTGDTPRLTRVTNVYQWVPAGDAAWEPTMAVDSNVASYTDPVTGAVQTDAHSGNVYVAWASQSVAPAGNPQGANFNPDVAELQVSSDGGVSFSAPVIVNNGGYLGSQRNASPQIVISQGRPAGESGISGDPGIPGGQVTVAWDNFGSLATASPPQDLLTSNIVTPGSDYGFTQGTPFAPAGNINFGTTTTFSQAVSIPASDLANLDALSVTVAITDPSLTNLGLQLIAPGGQTFTFFVPQTVGGTANTAIGISGANLGVINGFTPGTIFTDQAARSIVDIGPTGARGAAAPFIGQFQAENFASLDQFLAQVKAAGNVDGNWTLSARDTQTTAPTSPEFVNFWTINLTSGMLPSNNEFSISGAAQAGAPLPLVVVQGSLTNNYPRSSPATPNGVGPGLVLASDNTLGSFSPYEGRIYAAFTGYYNVTVDKIPNPSTNTDIFLVYSDNGGQTWNYDTQVNNDASTTDGYSQSNVTIPGNLVTGRPQFMPTIAVDQTTGTVVMTWRDARNDVAGARVATYIGSSIDGGATFSPETYANPQATAIDAITGQTVVQGPQPDNQSGGNPQTNTEFGYGIQMGLAVSGGQVYPIWSSNFNQGVIVAGAVHGVPLSIEYRPMVIAAGPRIVTSDMGPIPFAEAASGQVAFGVTFDRPINPPSLAGYTTTPSFVPGDVQVFYHDTTNGDASIPLKVLSVTPVVSSGVGPNNVFGFTQFTVVFSTSTQPTGAPSGITDFTGTYSYLIAPDNGSGTAIVSPVASFVNVSVPQTTIGPISSSQVGLPIPSVGTGGSGTSNDITDSSLNLSGYTNQTITGVQLNLSLNVLQDGGLFITLFAPNGNSTTVYYNPGDTGSNFLNTTFSDLATQSYLNSQAPYTGVFLPYNALAGLNGGPVDGQWTLSINDFQSNNPGTLVSWSLTVESSISQLVLNTGAPMDQNANGTGDQNPLTTPYTGLTPGDVYAVPTPQPVVPVTFGPNPLSILSPPFDQSTLPLIVPGPQVASTSVPNGSGSDNLIVNGTTSTMNVTFDRPMQVSTFTPAQVLSIMGPTGSITDPQYFPNDSVDQIIPTANSSGPGTLDSTLTVPNFGTSFSAGLVTLQLNITAPTDSQLTAVLISPTGTQVPLFTNVGGTGSNFTNTVFSDSALTSIDSGTAPFTGTYQAQGLLSSLIGQNVSGQWTLQLVNTGQNNSGVLVNWSLNITPQITVTPINPVSGLASTFQIGFPVQQLSGTYTIQLASTIKDGFGNGLDITQTAGLAVLRDQGQNNPTKTVTFTTTQLPRAIPSPSAGTAGTVISSINVPTSFIVQGDTTSSGISGLRVQLSITYPNDPDLTATLYYDYGGPSQIGVTLFSNVGNGPNTANFTNTILDDNATTPIQLGSAPFFATFNPQLSLAAFAGINAKGTWTLVLQNSATGSGATGTLNNWSLSFQNPYPTSGLGLPGADNASTSFRIFTLGQSDALSSQAWSAVGPAPISGRTGRIGGLAIDPSDPSGNTVYVGGASGGIWKTTDFLTTNPAGPTYIPLTDFGPTSGINIGGIAVFPVNNNPNQSIIIAATGEGDTGTPGVGFLISKDGGATWNLYDSTNNVDANGNLLPISSPLRNREFVGNSSFKVVVDPKLSPSGQVIIYAAMSGPHGGIWRSEDTGNTWQLMLAGQATDVVLDPNSGTLLSPDASVGVNGNLQVVYAGIRGVGVFISPNQGQVWNQMNGGIGNPLIIDTNTGKNVNPANGLTPNGAEGRIVLAVPTPTGNAAQDVIYSGWLYAAVADPSGKLYGIFVTKDFGQNWTQIRIPTLPPLSSGGSTYAQAIPTNDISQADYPILGGAGSLPAQGNYDITLLVDPADPNVIYVGGQQSGQTGLIRIDTTLLWDAHNLTAYSNDANGGPLLNLASTGPAAVDSNQLNTIAQDGNFASNSSYLNYIRNPAGPFVSDSTLQVFNYASFTNNGAGVTWIPFDMSGTDYHRVAAMIDPTTGLPRLIFGNDQGVWSVLDNNGTFQTTIGSNTALPGMNRNGNLQITQFYYGATQPSNAAAQVAGALFYGSAQDNGGPVSGSNILASGNLTWSGPGGDASGVGTDQQGSGSAYQFFWPCCGGGDTSFFQYIGPGQSGSGTYLGRTFGLLQASGGLPTPDPQWPLLGGANFAVNPVNSADVVISSSVGRIFATSNSGVTWFDIGDPAVFGSPGSFSVALAYGAPDPNAPEGLGNLGNFIYVGTATGQIYVTQDGGGNAQSNNWINVSTGLDGSTVQQIIANPNRGSHSAFAVTSTGVFYIANSVPSATNPTPTWVNITSNLHDLTYSIFGQSYNPTTDTNSITYNQAQGLTSILADWRYLIPNSPSDPNSGYHPVLYVGANSGVYQSVNDGLTWTLFPTTTFGAVDNGGNLPHAEVTSLTSSLGNIDPNTGFPTLAGPYAPNTPNATPDPNLLLASTYGRGMFSINLAPLVFPNQTALDPSSVSGTAPDGTPLVNTAQPILDGLSETSLHGNATHITILDITNPNSPRIIGGFDPSNLAGTNNAANWTNAFGQFSIQVNPGSYTTNGLKTVEIFATDNSGSVGNKVTISFTLNAANIAPPSPPTTPTLSLAAYDVTGAPGYTNVATPNLIGTTTPGATVELLQSNGQPFSPAVTTISDVLTGAFTLTFPNPTAASGTFTVEAVASNTVGSSAISTPVTFTILTGQPAAPSNFHLSPASDTGIVGDSITSNRQPLFIGTALPGATVELFQFGVSTVWDTVTANATTGDFTVQLPFSLTTGQISLYAETIDLAGNTSNPSNTLNLTIVSTTADYNGTGVSDPALFSRNTTANQLGWLVQTGGSAPPPWFGPSGTTFNYGPASVIPFQADFTGNGQTDLAYYSMSTATWSMDTSPNGAVTSFPLGTPNSSLPVVANFQPNAPAEAGVFTIVNGQGVWSISTSTSGLMTVDFGQAGDIPVPGNYDGLGYAEIAVYRPSLGEFLVLQPSGSVETLNLGVGSSPDLSSLVPTPGGYDNLAYFNAGHAERTEAAVFDPKTGNFVILGPTGPYTVTGFHAGDIPAPADYAGSGSTQPVVYRPSTNQFIGTSGTVIATLGVSGDIPLAAPLSYRMPPVTPATDPSSGTGTGTGTGTTGTGTTTTTGTGTTGTGTTTTTGTGTGTSTTTGTGTGSSTPGQGTGSTTTTTGTTTTTTTGSPPPQNPTAPTSPTSTGSNNHHKPAHRPRPTPTHHKRAVVHPTRHKVVQHHPKATHKVAHPVVTKVHHPFDNVAAHAPQGGHPDVTRKLAVDMALAEVQVNLRHSTKKHHG